MIRTSDLRSQEIISITSGKRLGYISDIDIDLTNGYIRAIVAPGDAGLWGMFGKGTEIVIFWDHIVKIGADVILVEVGNRGDTNDYEW